MDKKERNSIVQAKMTEVINEENKKSFELDLKNSEGTLEALNNSPLITEMRAIRKRHDEIITELNKMRETANNTIEKKKRNSIYINWSKLNDGYNGSAKTNKQGKEVPFYLSNGGYDSYSMTYQYRSDLMSMLVEHRNSDNKRIAKVAAAGLKLVFDGDESTIKDFLAL